MYEHQPCIKCDSSDALTIYYNEDGSIKDGFCFSCKTSFSKYELVGERSIIKVNKNNNPQKETIEDILKYSICELTDRGISKKAAQHYEIRVSFNESNGEIEKHYYPVYKYDNNDRLYLSGFKVRVVEDKTFYSIGDIKGGLPFGWNKITRKKFIIIVEGEADAAAAFDLLAKQGKSYPVVSILNSGSIKQNLKLISEFQDIVLAYDQDKVGKSLSKEHAKLFNPGQIRVATWKDYKDANEILNKGVPTDFLYAIYGAKEYRPDGIIRLSQAWDKLFEDDSIKSVPYPWKGLNKKLYGLRPREIVTLTAGSGSGKSAICREIEHWLLKQIPEEDNIGILALEENIGRTAWGLMAIEASKPLHIREERTGIKTEDFKVYFDNTVGTGRYIAYDHFGSTSSDNLISQIKYMIKGMNCKWIFLDHLSIVVSDMEEAGDERRTIDTIMTKLRQLTEETGASLIIVVHLRRMAGDKGHEKGGEVTLNQLRGSHSIAHLSDAVIAAERDQQALNEIESNMTLLRVIKNRYAGYVGPAGWLYYDKSTGRLSEVEDKLEFIREREEIEREF